MVGEVVNYRVVSINIQPKETCVKPEIVVFDEPPRPHFDKKVSADNGEDMEETPQHKSQLERCRKKFHCHLQLKGPQKT